MAKAEEAKTQKQEIAVVDFTKENVLKITNLTEQMGLNPQEQINKQNTGMGSQPFLKIDHDDKTGKHGFYIQLPEGIFDDTGVHHLGTREEPVNELDIQVVLFEDTRAIFEEGVKVPKCAAASGKVLSFINESLNSGKRTCDGCPYNAFNTDCKPRIRTLIGFKYKFEGQDEQIYPFLFHITTASLSYWNKFTKRLKASKVPIQSFSIKLGLEDYNETYRYAKTTLDINRPINQEELAFATEVVKNLRAEFEKASVAEFVQTSGEATTSGSEDDEVAF